MDKKAAEMLSEALAHIAIIPSFNFAILLSDDVADVTGFQIMCKVNNLGRALFSVHGHTEGGMSYNESLEIFEDKYKEIHGNPIRELKKHDIETPNYPSFGADYVKDLSPATIVRIIRTSFEKDDNTMEGVLTAYIMRLSQEITRWSNHFEMLAKKSKILATCFEKILQESL